MLIKEENKFKDMFIKKCEFINETIYFIFISGEIRDITYILICINETSIEEMHSFFYKTILCDYNT